MPTAGANRRFAGFFLTLATAATAVLSAAPAPDEAPGDVPVRVDIQFRDATECAVAVGNGAAIIASSPEPSSGDFVCPLTGITPRRPVNLAVTLPPGIESDVHRLPAAGVAPHRGSWTGTAALPSAPAFVRVGGPSGALARRARWLDIAALAGTFGAILWTLGPRYTARARANLLMPWNFYAWFIFSAAFIGAYFLWVWTTTRR